MSGKHKEDVNLDSSLGPKRTETAEGNYSPAQRELQKTYSTFREAIISHRRRELLSSAEERFFPLYERYRQLFTVRYSPLRNANGEERFDYQDVGSPGRKTTLTNVLGYLRGNPEVFGSELFVSTMRDNGTLQEILAKEFSNCFAGRQIIDHFAKLVVDMLLDQQSRSTFLPTLTVKERKRAQAFIRNIIITDSHLLLSLLENTEYFPAETNVIFNEFDVVMREVLEAMVRCQEGEQPGFVPRQEQKLELFFAEKFAAALCSSEKLGAVALQGMKTVTRKLRAPLPSELGSPLPLPTEIFDALVWSSNLNELVYGDAIPVSTANIYGQGGEKKSRHLFAKATVQLASIQFLADVTAEVREFNDYLNRPLEELQPEHSELVACCVAIQVISDGLAHELFNMYVRLKHEVAVDHMTRSAFDAFEHRHNFFTTGKTDPYLLEAVQANTEVELRRALTAVKARYEQQEKTWLQPFPEFPLELTEYFATHARDITGNEMYQALMEKLNDLDERAALRGDDLPPTARLSEIMMRMLRDRVVQPGMDTLMKRLGELPSDEIDVGDDGEVSPHLKRKEKGG